MSNFDQFFGTLRIPGKFNLATNPNFATVVNTYETLLSDTGSGAVSAIAFNTSGPSSEIQLTKIIIEVTVDGGTPYEIDMGNHIVSGGSASTRLWTGSLDPAVGDDNAMIPLTQQYKTSILLRAKTDITTTQIGGSVSYSSDL